MTASADSVTALLRQLQAGDLTAFAPLYKRYWPLLVGLARKKLKGAATPVHDEEDIASAAFWSFFHRFEDNQFPDLANSADLLKLLTCIVTRKAINEIQKRHGTLKHGAGMQQADADALLHLTGDGPTPEEQAIVREYFERYVNGLPDKLRPFAILYLEDHTNKEIAQQLRVSERTVERKLALIRDAWCKLAQADDLPG